MKSVWIVAAVWALAATAASAQDTEGSVVAAAKGQTLLAQNGGRLGSVYRVGQDGSVQMIIDGHMVTVPASTLSSVDGHLTTSLTKSEVLALH
jgi:hypothetical protein